MGRGVSSGGGKSSLGYLFGGVPNKATKENAKPASPSPPLETTKLTPAGIHSPSSNNYKRADGQNIGNFITDRPSTKVRAAPGGRSSLDYLFAGADK